MKSGVGHYIAIDGRQHRNEAATGLGLTDIVQVRLPCCTTATTESHHRELSPKARLVPDSIRRAKARAMRQRGVLLVMAVLVVSIPTLAMPSGSSEVQSTRPPIPVLRPVIVEYGSGPQFSAVCPFSHRLADDPIVHPGQPGASHLHDFFGNTSTNAHSTPESMLDTPSTCRRDGDQSGYWTPTLYNGGTPVQPLRATAYYRARVDRRTIAAPPAGLRMIAGAPHFQWRCALPAELARRVDGPSECTEDEMLDLLILFPDCWDGVHLDSPNHKSHMAYNTDRTCPSSHPVPLPSLELPVRYPILGMPRAVTLAPLEAPSAPHADFLNAWDQNVLERLVKHCINAGVNCGNTGPRIGPGTAAMRP